MDSAENLTTKEYPDRPYRTTRERLTGANNYLTSFVFRRGANFYVFSYENDGKTKHTFIDTGDSRYRAQILSILAENDIDPAAIERIIITHRHFDHCGLADLLARESQAKILVHSNFRSLVEGELTQSERQWMQDFDPDRLKEQNIVYLSPSNKSKSIDIFGVAFPGLTEPIKIGERGRLFILACPESEPTHSPDQIIILYSPEGNPYTGEQSRSDSLPTDDILFSGDLWLMTGPVHDMGPRTISDHITYRLRRLRNLISRRHRHRPDHREQDSQAKEAVKRGFCLVRVKPGHGEEFIGSRIIPRSLLANRDLLLELGYPNDTNKPILKSEDLAPRITDIKEGAYASFTKELLLWTELGYTLSDISELLARIYREQRGGGALVERDRKERRQSMESMLARLENDQTQSSALRQLAESTLSKLKAI
jgi:hypothetical protein